MLFKILGLMLTLALGLVAVLFSGLRARRATGVEPHPTLRAWVEGHEPQQPLRP